MYGGGGGGGEDPLNPPYERGNTPSRALTLNRASIATGLFMNTCMQAHRHIVKSGLAEVRASAECTIEGESTRGGVPTLVRGVRGIPTKTFFFYLWTPLCAFLMHFGSVFSRFGKIWDMRHLHIHN